MKIKATRKEKEFIPIELNITLETKAEEIFWLTVFNSCENDWEKFYNSGTKSLPNIEPLTEDELDVVTRTTSDVFWAVDERSMEDTSND